MWRPQLKAHRDRCGTLRRIRSGSDLVAGGHAGDDIVGFLPVQVITVARLFRSGCFLLRRPASLSSRDNSLPTFRTEFPLLLGGRRRGFHGRCCLLGSAILLLCSHHSTTSQRCPCPLQLSNLVINRCLNLGNSQFSLPDGRSLVVQPLSDRVYPTHDRPATLTHPLFSRCEVCLSLRGKVIRPVVR